MIEDIIKAIEDDGFKVIKITHWYGFDEYNISKKNVCDRMFTTSQLWVWYHGYRMGITLPKVN